MRLRLRHQLVAATLVASSSLLADTSIYPFKPLPTAEINEKSARLSEETAPLNNIFEMDRRRLNIGNTSVQPWSGSYWPLNQGMIANTYQEKTFLKPWKYLSWTNNHNAYKKRAPKVQSNPYSLDEEQLAKLAPSEKYDLLLGDTSFDLTTRVWDFAQKWGSGKKWNFLSSIDLPAGYRLPKGNSLMALWEGICHGWAVAAGAYPRPEKTVYVKLPNGKQMPFYPNDIKALISLLFANSIVQDNVIMEGLRCKFKSPKKDKYGRYIDELPRKPGEEHLPACADVHPAVMHISMVNITGIQGRSFVVDKSATASISNQPVKGYEYRYYNPETGKFGTLQESMLARNVYSKDPFASARNADSRYIVGVQMDLHYMDWVFPVKEVADGPEFDKIGTKTFNYDLELNARGEIVGGQWRVIRKGRVSPLRLGSTHQPDFMWVLPKNYMNYFQPVPGLEDWNPSRQATPPASWQSAAKVAHGFTYNVTREFGFNEKCTVIGERRRMGTKDVPCEFKYPRPQPLIQVVNKLLQMSRQ